MSAIWKIILSIEIERAPPSWHNYEPIKHVVFCFDQSEYSLRNRKNYCLQKGHLRAILSSELVVDTTVELHHRALANTVRLPRILGHIVSTRFCARYVDNSVKLFNVTYIHNQPNYWMKIVGCVVTQV